MNNDQAVKSNQQWPVNQAPNADMFNHYGHFQFSPTLSSSSSSPLPSSSSSSSSSSSTSSLSSSSSSSTPLPLPSSTPLSAQPPLMIDLDGQQYVGTMDSTKRLAINKRMKKRGLANFEALKLSVDTVDVYNKVHNLRVQYYMQNSNNRYKNHHLKELDKKVLMANNELDCLEKKLKKIRKLQRMKRENSRNVAVSRQQTAHNVPDSDSESDSESELQSTILQIPSAPTVDEQAEFYPHELNGVWLHCHSCNLIHY